MFYIGLLFGIAIGAFFIHITSVEICDECGEDIDDCNCWKE